MAGGAQLPGYPNNRRTPPKPGTVITDPNSGRSSSYTQTGPNGEMGYVGNASAAPTQMRDPNTGNLYNWNGHDNKYDLFSQGHSAVSDLSAIASRFNGLFGNGNGANVTATSERVPRVSLDTGAIDAGQRAAFSRAKDTVGQASQGLMRSVKNQFASRGLRGSSMEGRAIGSGLESSFGQLADVSREQAIQSADRTTDLVKTSYGGDITQRGQDLNAQQAAEALAASQNNAQNQARMNAILGLFSAARSGGGPVY